MAFVKVLTSPLNQEATNIDGSLPLYKNPNAPIEERANDLLPRMSIERVSITDVSDAFYIGLCLN